MIEESLDHLPTVEFSGLMLIFSFAITNKQAHIVLNRFGYCKCQGSIIVSDMIIFYFHQELIKPPGDCGLSNIVCVACTTDQTIAVYFFLGSSAKSCKLIGIESCGFSGACTYLSLSICFDFASALAITLFNVDSHDAFDMPFLVGTQHPFLR